MWSFEHCGCFVLRAAVMKAAWWRKKQDLLCWALSAADPINASLIVCTQISFCLLHLTGGRKAGFFIWMRTVSSGFAEVLVSCWFSFLPTYFGTAISSTNLNTNKRGVPPNAGTVCGEFICHLPALQHCTAEWHFFQKTGLEQTCHVCLHMNNPSLLMSARCINHDNPSCSTTKHR